MKRIKLLIVTLVTGLSLTAQVGNELYRPVFHYSPAYNWMNDPNGLVYYNGKYHMFYQYNPYGIQWGNMSWGHAISTDLVNWEEKPVAIPVQNGVMAFSGSVVVDWKNTSGFGINDKPPLVAIYTGASNVQDQRIAYSNDEGITWTNYSQNPVLSLRNKDFRDPKVIWHQETNKWIMVIGLGSNRKIRFYSSVNLKDWTFLQDFGPVGNTCGVWECPDFFKLNVDDNPNNSKWVLVLSVGNDYTQYFIGDFDGKHFTWEKTLPNGILIDDAENNNYENWTVTGTSFGNSPASGTLPTQRTVSGYLGNRFINSYFNGNKAQGKMVSSDFTILKNNISFLIGGGNYPSGTYIKLVVNGETVRKTTGLDDNYMRWRNWDVSNLSGQTAHIEIVDSMTSSWGHINVDHIIQSDLAIDNVNNGLLDYGKDFYGVQSFSDIPATDGRRIWLAWMNNWNYVGGVPTKPWKGIMSIPREIKLVTHNGQLKLVQKPIAELNSLRKNGLSFKNTTISEINNSLRTEISNVLNPTFKQFELKARVAVLSNNGFALKFKKYGLQYSEIIFDFINKEIRFNRAKSGVLTTDRTFRTLQIAPLVIRDGFIDFQLFVDNCSAELFSAGGQVVMSNQIFPDNKSNKIELMAFNEDIIFAEFDIWKIEKTVIIADPVTEKHPLFRVYPNPVVNNNGITIKIKNGMAGKIKFRLFNASGKLISEFQSFNNSIIIPKNKFTGVNGLYFLTGSNGTTTQTEKLSVPGY